MPQYGRDYIPPSDAGFDIFQNNFYNGVQPNLVAWGIPTANWMTLTNLRIAWNMAWLKAKDKDSRSREDVQAKRDAKRIYQKELRGFIRSWVAFNPKVSDANREGLGLKVKDIEPTPMPIPDRAPDITIDTIRHLVHKLRLTDPDNPHTQAKPKGVREIEVFRFFGDTPPPSVSEYEFVGNATRFLYTVNYKKADMGKRVFYIARYVNTRGIPGPWSTAVKATVA